MKIVILGAGVTGLTAAYKLCQQDHDVLILEKEPFIGGALSSTEKNGYSIENFHHHVFADDKEFFKLLEELKLSSKLEWRNATTAFFHNGNFYNLSSPLDIIPFSMLSLVDKANLARLMLRIKLVRDFKKYDNIVAKDFIIKNSSEKVYEVFFEPLLNGKFGANKESVSAAWLIRRLQLRTNRGTKGELLGYLEGGFSIFIKALEKEVNKNKGKILTSIEVTKIDNKNKTIITNKGNFVYDRLISTIPPQTLNKLAAKEITKHKIHYQGAVCLLLSTKEKITDIYWTNIMGKFVFGALIEHTNFIPAARYKNEHLIYLASYYNSDDNIWEEKESTIVQKYLRDLHKIKKIEKINWLKLFRYRYSGIIYSLGCLSKMPGLKTEDPNIFIAGMFTSYPERSINESIKFGKVLSKIAGKKEKPLVCITMPVYNEEKVLGSSIMALRNFLNKEFKYPYYIVIADNASKDKTRKIGESLAKRFNDVKFCYIPVKGRGIALRTVWSKYDADIYCYMDIDLSTNLEAFPKLIDKIAKEGYDISTGSRFGKNAKTTRSLKREVLSRGYNLLLKTTFNHSFKDAQCGFKAVSKEITKKIMPKVVDNNWFFDTELMMKAEHAGYKVAEIVVAWIEDPYSKVKITSTVIYYLKSVYRLRKELKVK